MKERDEGIARVHGAALVPGTGDLSPETLEKLDFFIGEQLDWSARIHIVGKQNPEAALAAQIRDSLAMLRFAADLAGPPRRGEYSGPIVDVGTGYGFPGFIWKLADDRLLVTLVERKERAATFLERLAASMKLSGIRIVRGDAEKLERLGVFNLFTSKASGRLDKMLPLALRLLEPGGFYVTAKGRDWRREIEGALCAGMEFFKEKEIPGGGGVLVAFRKGKSGDS